MLAYKLLKTASNANDVDNDTDTVVDDIKEGYQLAQKEALIPASVLGSLGFLSGHGLGNRIIRGTAGVGAGVLGTIGSRALSDVLQRRDNKKKIKDAKFNKELENY